MATRKDDFTWFLICSFKNHDFYYNGKQFQKQYRPVVGKATRSSLTQDEIEMINKMNYQEIYDMKKNIIVRTKNEGKKRIWNNQEYYRKRF